MLLATKKIDITPSVGVELCGFAQREQPSDNVLDLLYCKILLIAEPEVPVLLIQLDLIGLERDFVLRLRKKAGAALNIPENHIQFFATHTHSGPGTIKLNACGDYNPEYLNWLEEKVLFGLSKMNMEDGVFEDCRFIFYRGRQDIGINRRNRSPGADSGNIWILGFQRPDKSYKAILLNMAMHPVCLKGTGISADYPGQVTALIESRIAGKPLVLFSLGAAGDIDPPGVGVSYGQMLEWSNQLADIYYGLLTSEGDKSDLEVSTSPIRQEIKIERKALQISEIQLDNEAVDVFANTQHTNEEALNEFGSDYLSAVELWRQSRKNELRGKNEVNRELEISLLSFGGIKIVFVNAELFSSLTDLIMKAFSDLIRPGAESKSRMSSDRKGNFIIVSCANGLEGYLPDIEQFDRGGYEAEISHIFYDSWQKKPGTLEYLANEIALLL